MHHAHRSCATGHTSGNTNIYTNVCANFNTRISPTGIANTALSEDSESKAWAMQTCDPICFASFRFHLLVRILGKSHAPKPRTINKHQRELEYLCDRRTRTRLFLPAAIGCAMLSLTCHWTHEHEYEHVYERHAHITRGDHHHYSEWRLQIGSVGNAET